MVLHATDSACCRDAVYLNTNGSMVCCGCRKFITRADLRPWVLPE